MRRSLPPPLGRPSEAGAAEARQFAPGLARACFADASSGEAGENEAPARWRRWGWGRRLTAGALALLALALLGGALFYAFAVRPDRRAAPYRQAMERLRANPSAARLLGEPIAAGWFVQGHAGADSARLAIPVSGPARAGTLQLDAQKVGSAWVFSRLELAVPDNGLHLSLLEEERQRRRSDGDRQPPLEVPPRYRGPGEK